MRASRVSFTDFCLSLFLILIIFPACSNSQSVSEEHGNHPVQPKPEASVDPFVQNQKLGRGVNLGNALEAPTEGEWGMTVQEEYIQLISDAGFDAVRIPVRWNAHAADESPYKINKKFFNRIDEVIGWALERDLMVVLNIHHYNALMEQPQEHRERFLALWQQIAEHYHDAPNNLLFEVLNEPHGKLSGELWNNFLSRGIDVIRESNPYRTLIIGTAPWGGIGGLENLSVPGDDQNIIVTVHYYEPFHFTHQGASWAGDESSEWLGTTWTATSEQQSKLDKDFDFVQRWANEHNRPIYLGEFGAYNAAPLESRKTWTSHIRQAAEERDFSWSYWEFGAGFGVFDRDNGQWRSGLLEALVPGSPELN